MSGAPRRGVVVRVATGAEVADAGTVTAQAYAADHLLAPDDEYADELLDAPRRAREATLLVAVVQGERDGDVVVGTITLAAHGSPYAEVARPGEHELRMLAVAPQARRHGVAAALMFAALREAVAAGTTRVVLSTLDAMHAAHALYERLGFAAVPERDWPAGRGKVLHVRAWTPPPGPELAVEAGTWPPVRVVDVDGWRAGLSGGLTRRANSVLPLAAPADVAAALDRVEALYAQAHQPAVFRVDADARPAGLDGLLAARGYRTTATADVLVRPLAGVAAPPPGVAVETADGPDGPWLALWAGARPSPDGAARLADFARDVLAASPALYLTAHGAHGVLGVVRAALAGEWVGLSCLVVDERARGRGLGRALTLHALHAAALRGATRAFLQVEVENTAAATLYARLGFLPAARYHYRRQP